MAQSIALAYLTTYTDSESDDDIYADEHNTGSVTVPSPITPTSSTSSPITSKASKLVSYHDDTNISDDENMNDSTIPTVISTDDQFDSTELDLIDEDGVDIPPEPTGNCAPEMQDKITLLYNKMKSTATLDMNAAIQQRKDFRNPRLCEKLITFCGIYELGTNYPPSIYDPLKWGKESYYEELVKVQEAEMDKREKQQKSNNEFGQGMINQKERLNKWNQSGGICMTSLKPAGLVKLVKPALENSVTRTKPLDLLYKK